MKSKEKIDALKKQLILHPSYLNIIEELEKDLEVLEILKEHIIFKNIEYGDTYNGFDKIDIIFQVVQMKPFEIKSDGKKYYPILDLSKDFNKIKEWLEK